MRKFNYFIGTDVSKSVLDFAVRSLDKLIFHTQVENSKQGLIRFEKQCKKNGIDYSDALICLEHTGIYSNKLLYRWSAKNCSIWVESAINIKRSLGLQRGKNDKVDAIRISEYAFRFLDKCKLWSPKRDVVEKIKMLTNAREQLIVTNKRLKVSVKENKKFINKSILKPMEDALNPIIQKVDSQITSIEKQINQLIKEDQNLSRIDQIVQSVEGVGKITSWNIIIATNEFKNVTDGRKFACYSGVVPFEYQSGSSIKGRSRVSPMANKTIKTLLHMSTISILSKGKGELFEYYERKVAEGKHKMSVINADKKQNYSANIRLC